MTLIDETVVGKRGEILMKKNVRSTAGIQPGDKIYIEASDGQILIRKVYSIDEIFSRPPIATGTPESIEKELDEEGQRQEELSDE